MNNMGSLISNKRHVRGYSIDETAKLLGISRMTLARLEANQTKIIDISNIIQISNVLEIDFSKLIAAYGKKLINLDIKNALKLNKRIFYEGVLLDKGKFVELIESNIHELTVYKELPVK